MPSDRVIPNESGQETRSAKAVVTVPADSPLGRRVAATMAARHLNEGTALLYLVQNDPVAARWWEEYRNSILRGEEVHKASALRDLKTTLGVV